MLTTKTQRQVDSVLTSIKCWRPLVECVIRNYEWAVLYRKNGGIKMTVIESLVKAIRLAWLKRIFIDHEYTWKFYLLHLLRNVGGILIFKCNYAMNDLSINSVFYRELLECWLEFRNLFLANKERLCIIWNNKDIRIDGKPVFYKSYYDSGICIIKDLLFNLDNIESFNAINNIVEKANFLTWTGLRHAIPSILKTREYTTFTEILILQKGMRFLTWRKRKRKTTTP